MSARRFGRIVTVVVVVGAVVLAINLGLGYPMAFRAGDWREALGEGPAKAPSYRSEALLDRDPVFRSVPFAKQARESLIKAEALSTNSPYPDSLILGNKQFRITNRPVLLAPAPSEIAYRVTVPADARLEFGYGRSCFLDGRLQGGVGFSLEWRDQSDATELFHEEIPACEPGFWDLTRKRRRIWRRYLHPAFSNWGDAYRDASVDLSALAGKRGELWFITRQQGPGKSPFTAAAWSSPEVWARRPAREPSPLNVVLFMIEATPTTVVEPYVTHPAVTPHLRDFAGRAVVFEKYFTAGDSTQLSTFCFFTGRHYRAMGLPNEMYFLAPMVKARYYRHDYATLAEAFGRSGYRTAQIGSNVFFLPNRQIGLDMGFDEVDTMHRSYYTSADTTLATMQWLRRNGDKPFFLYIHYDAPHDEEKPVVEDLLSTIPVSIGDGRWRYRKYLAQEISADRDFGRLLEALSTLGIRERTVVIVTADHGNCLDPKHDFAVIRSDRRPWWTPFQHGRAMRAEDIHVPMIIGWPGLDEGRRVSAPVASIDLFPTLVDLLLPDPGADFNQRMQGIDGKSFAGVLKNPDADFAGGDAIYSVSAGGESLIADGRWHYFRRAPGFEKILYPGRDRFQVVREGLFDLEADPRELEDLSNLRPDLMARMRGLMARKRPVDATLRFIYFNHETGTASGSIGLSGDSPPSLVMSYPEDRPAFMFTRKPGEDGGAALSFESALSGPAGIILDRPIAWIDLRVDSKAVALDEVRLGPFGLPLLISSGCGSETGIRIEECGLPKGVLMSAHHPFRFQSEPGVYLYEMKFADFVEETFSDETLSPAVKSVLKQWGYIE